MGFPGCIWKKKEAVDYRKLIQDLEKRIEKLEQGQYYGTVDVRPWSPIWLTWRTDDLQDVSVKDALQALMRHLKLTISYEKPKSGGYKVQEYETVKIKTPPYNIVEEEKKDGE